MKYDLSKTVFIAKLTDFRTDLTLGQTKGSCVIRTVGGAGCPRS